MPDIFSWSPGEWEMVLKAAPWWLYIATTALAVLLALFTIIGVTVKNSARARAPEGVPNVQSAGNNSTVTRDIAVGPAGSSSAAVAQGGSRVSQPRIAAGSIGPDTKITMGDGNHQTINNTFNIYNSIDEPGLGSTVYRGELKTANGLDATVEVMILWKGASWQFGTLKYNNGALTRFLESPAYEDALSNGDAIVCIGLSSHWLDKQRTTPIQSLSPSAITANEEKTDERAFKLCQRLAQHAQARDISPAFFGAGLGYHLDPVTADEGEEKQRAIVLVRVNTGIGVPPAKTELRSLLEQVLQHPDILEFEGSRYSRVSQNSPICWFRIEIGHFQANLDECE